LRRGYGCEAFILGLLAGFAPLGLILQSFIVKEDLLASRPDEILSAVNTLDRAIIEFRLRVTPLSVRAIRDLSLCHDFLTPTDMCLLIRAEIVR
jgi:hypothetical protein